MNKLSESELEQQEINIKNDLKKINKEFNQFLNPNIILLKQQNNENIELNQNKKIDSQRSENNQKEFKSKLPKPMKKKSLNLEIKSIKNNIEEEHLIKATGAGEQFLASLFDDNYSNI